MKAGTPAGLRDDYHSSNRHCQLPCLPVDGQQHLNEASDSRYSLDLAADEPCTPRREHSRCSTATVLTINIYTSHSSSEDYSSSDEAISLVPSLPRFAVPEKDTKHIRSSRNSILQTSLVVIACIFWVALSSAAILINKHIMVDLSFHFPAAVAALGMLGTTAASVLACAVLRLVPCTASVSPYFFFTRVMSTAFFTALSFQAGNTAYLYLSVVFVQMLKAFTPVSTMLCGFLYKLEKPSAQLIAAVCCICSGVILSSYGEVNFSLFGVVAMLISVAAEGLRIVMMQHLLAAKQFHPLEAWMYLGPACCIWLLVLVGVFEIHQIQDQHGWAILQEHRWYFAFAAVAGFAVNASAMSVIKLASALTLKVLGICKDVGLVVSGVLLLGESVTGLQCGGYSVSLLGFACYNYMKVTAAASPDNIGLGAQQQRQSLGPKSKALPSLHSPLRKKSGLIGTAAQVDSLSLSEPLLADTLPMVSVKRGLQDTRV